MLLTKPLLFLNAGECDVNAGVCDLNAGECDKPVVNKLVKPVVTKPAIKPDVRDRQWRWRWKKLRGGAWDSSQRLSQRTYADVCGRMLTYDDVC